MRSETENRVDPLAFLMPYQEQYRETVRGILEEMGLSQSDEVSPEQVRSEIGRYLTQPNELSRAVIAERERT